jgi:type IV pilus assembly protein PilW
MFLGIASRKKAGGFSIVELMVGMVLALIGILVVMQVYLFSEGRKRTTTSGGDAQSNGAIALYTLQKDTAQAGYGMANLDILNCTVRAYNQNRSPTDFTFTSTAPVTINPTGIPAGDANTDVVRVAYGTSEGLAEGVSFRQQSGASANYQVDNRAGFTVGNMVIAAQSGLDCTLTQITNLPASGSCGQGGGGQTDVVVHDPGNLKDPGQNCEQVPSLWNKPGGLGVTYTSGKLYDMGRLPITHIYAVRNGNLTLCDLTSSDCTSAAQTGNTAVWVPIVNNIVSLKAQYGRDTSAPMDMVVDTYDQTTPVTACGYARVPAVRLAVVARSPQYEKDAVTPAAPTWLGGTIDLSKKPDGTANPDWQRYRYKLFETVIPLRNIVWMGVQPSC